MSIPRLILQTGKTRQLSSPARAAAANLRLLHPDWEFRFFDDRDIVEFVGREFPQYRAIFDGFAHPIQRIDFFRYLAIYRLGGFYFDLDVFLWESLNNLPEATSVFPFEELSLNRHLRTHYRMDWEIGNYAFGATAGHPFLGAIIENCARGQRDPAWIRPMMKGIPALFSRDFEVLNSTGPGLVSRTLAENPQLARTVTVLFPENVCDRSTWHHFGSLGVHLMDGSWRQRGNFLRRRLALWWECREQKRLLGQSLQLGKARAVGTVAPALPVLFQDAAS